ncbi:c-type cytochrome [Sinorhizobium terangae]|uniref:c-type cytochrome n=1 Tax=Sinorhizobium terangae TaxID=110322 RepID=UPI0012969264|nr:c-type cytochrome [Sinorhizobium terangae]WFU51582.1 c-type cytochrome [Sinorhizobium terangae]
MPGKVLNGSVAQRLATILCILSLVGLAALIGLERQPRQYRTDPPVAAALNQLRLMPAGIGGAPPEIYFALDKPYETSAYDLSQGKRLYSWFGCPSCHGDGRGGAGPSLLDGWWLYGPSLVAIASSIRDGRPRGMPAFRSRMTTDQIWQLAGYVKTIGAYSASLTAPSRNDDKHTRPAENRAPAAILFNEDRPVLPRSEQGPPS